MTALRWKRILSSLGHRVRVETRYTQGRADLLIALHADRSHGSVARFRRRHPSAPLVVALTGTDIYPGTAISPRTRRSLELADRVVALQPLALEALPKEQRRKSRVIYQSVGRSVTSASALVAPAAAPFRARSSSRTADFTVMVVAHLRDVKDPFRAALASRLLPPCSRLRVLHVGAALSPAMARRAAREERTNPRYRWLGERPRAEVLRRLACSRALVLSSKREGGANVVSEAIWASVPVIASRIPGSIGLLGRRYPGYYRGGDTRGLARQLQRLERDAGFRARLRRHIASLAPLVDPARERGSWAQLLSELVS